MSYGRISYQAQVQDATVGVAFTAFRYHLEGEFTDLDATGTEEIASVYASYPLIRSRNNNLYATVDYDYRIFRDTIGLTDTTTDKAASVVTIGLNGDSHDTFGGGGWNTYSIAGIFGDLDIQSSAAREIDAATARTNGGYGKVYGSVSRLQNLIGPLSLYGWFRGQAAFQNLDISEKMELGGATGVRAYPEGEAYGDQGYIATAEARLALPKWPPNLPGEFQLVGFVDSGYVTFNHSPWGPGPNSAVRSGVGVGLNWTEANNFIVSVGIAHRLGDPPATSAPDRLARVWVQVIVFF
jgi:hemolysin activation/secretion protein